MIRGDEYMLGIEAITVNEQSSIKVAGSSVLYFDPFHIKKEELDADIVFLTHGHYDHFSPDDIGKVASGNALFVVPWKMVRELEDTVVSQERIIAIQPGEEKKVTDRKGNVISVKAVPAYNKIKPFHPKIQKWCGYVVNIDDKVLYVAGDTDALKENESIDCDIAFIPIGGTYTMNYKEAAHFVNRLKPKIAVPIHYGTILGEKVYGDRFAELIDDDIEVVNKLFEGD